MRQREEQEGQRDGVGTEVTHREGKRQRETEETEREREGDRGRQKRQR